MMSTGLTKQPSQTIGVGRRDELPAITATAAVAIVALPVGETVRVAIGCCLALFQLGKRAASGDTGPRLERSSGRWLAATGVWLALAALVGVEPALSLMWLVALGGFVMFGASLVHWFGTNVALRVMFTALSLPVFVALVSIAGPIIADRTFDVSDRAVLSKDMVAFFAVVLALLARFSPALARLPKFAPAATYLVAVVVVVASDSRSMAVAAIVALGVGLVQERRIQLIATAVLVGLAGWSFAVLFLGIDAGGVFDLISADVAEGGGRDNLWASAWAALVDRPLFGFGVGTHADILLEYRIESLFAIDTVTTHSTLLFAGLAGGFPAIALLVGSTATAVKVGTTTMRIILAALVLFGLGDAPFETPGVAAALLGIAMARGVATRRPVEGRRPSSAGRWAQEIVRRRPQVQSRARTQQ